MRFYPDHQSLLPAYDRGEIDGVSWIWPQEMADAAKRKDLQLFTAPLSGYTLVYLNQQNPNLPFFKEAAVRQALLYALDRQTLMDTVLSGQGWWRTRRSCPAPGPTIRTVKQYGYDPDRASQLLDEAGWKDSDGDGVRDRDGVKLAFVLLGNDRR